MTNPGITYEQWQEAERALNDCENNKAAAARSLGQPPETFRNRLNRGRARFAGRAGVDGSAPDGYIIKGRSTLYGPDGDVRAEWVKTTADRERLLEIAMDAVKEAARELPQLEARPKLSIDYDDKLMTVIPWGDPHFGMYAWAEEAGADFDSDIARRDLCAAVDYLIGQSPASKECVIASLGDFFHADNHSAVTPGHGHSLDVDTRLQRVMRIGVSAIRQCIETALNRHETVHFVPVVGNHDPVLGMAMGVLLANVYQNEVRVKVHDAPTMRHYIRHGKVLLGFVHGDKTKDSSLPGIMATERPEDWGKTTHRYFFRGHHHHDARAEYNGCIVEQVRTLAANDAYSTSRGFLSGRDMKLIVVHEEHGEVSRTTCSVDMLRNARGHGYAALGGENDQA